MGNIPQKSPGGAGGGVTSGLEDRLLGTSMPSSWQNMDEVSTFFEEVVSRFVLPKEVLALLTPADTADVQMTQFLKALQLFPLDREKLSTLILSKRSMPKGSATEDVLLRMFGTENTRNFIIAVAAFQLVYGKNFEWHRDLADPKIQPDQLLQCALKAQSGYEGRALDLAFCSGLIFDVLLMIVDRIRPRSPRVKTFIVQTFEQGLRSAKLAIEISKRVRDLKFAEHVYSACILSGVGKSVAVLLKDDALDFFTSQAKDGLPLSFDIICEEMFFGRLLGYYEGQLVALFPSLKPIQDAVHFLRQPHVLNSLGHRDLGNLAMVACLARQMERYPFPYLKKADDPAFTVHCTNHWKIPEVKDLQLGERDLFNIASAFEK